MKILYICSTLSRSGPTNQLFSLLRHLVKQGVDCTVVTISKESEDSRLTDFLDLGIQHRCLQRSGWRFWTSRHRNLYRLVRSVSPDIIHSSGIRADYLSARFLSAYPTVSTIHNIPWEDYAFRYGNLTGRAMLRMQLSCWKRIRTCAAVSEYLATQLEQRYPHLSVVTIPNGVDIALYQNSGSDVPDASSLAAFPRPIFINSEGFIPLKNPLCLIHGFMDYKQKGGEGTLLFVGDGPLLAKARHVADGRDDIVFFPRTSSVVDYYLQAGYFVSASRSEGLPLALLEALSCGLIPVVSAIGSRYEILQGHAFVENLFHPDRPEEFAEKLVRASEQDATRHASFFNDIRKRYSDAEMARKYLDVYKKLLR